MLWLVALLALAETGIGWSIDYLPEGSQSSETAWLVHTVVGIGLVGLVIAAAIWQSFSRSPEYPPASPNWLQISLRISASLLVILLLAAAATGYLAWSFSGGATPSWTLWLPPSVAVGRNAGAMFSRWHEISAIAVVIPILSTLNLLIWRVLAEFRMPRPTSKRRRVLAPSQKPSAPASSMAPETAEPDEGLLTKGRALARHLKLFGAVAFWVQLSLGLIAALLLVVTTSSSYYEENLQSLPRGFSWAEGTVWAYLSLVVLALTIMGFYSCVLRARALKRGEVGRTGGARLKRLISMINFGSALGLTLAIFGNALSIELLISKTVSQPPGIAITDPQAIVRAVDVFVLLANFVIVVAHFIGILTCLWIRNRVSHLSWWPKR